MEGCKALFSLLEPWFVGRRGGSGDVIATFDNKVRLFSFFLCFSEPFSSNILIVLIAVQCTAYKLRPHRSITAADAGEGQRK